MNYKKWLGILLMIPLIVLIVGLLGILSYLILCEAPYVYVLIIVIISFIYGVGIYDRAR